MIRPSNSAAVAPNVLVQLVSMALREVPGITRFGVAPHGRNRSRGAGVAIQFRGGGVCADCYVIANAEANLPELGITAQTTVAAVIEELAGMPVCEVNIYIQDVEASSG